MVFANVMRVSLQGAMPNGEVWSVNPTYQIGGVNTNENVTAEQCLAIATAIDALTIPTGVTGMNSNGVSFTGCRVEARQWDGTLVSQAEHARATPVMGSVSNLAHPFQTSMVASLRTSGVGARARGRLYFPATGVALTNTLRPVTLTVTTALSGVRTWLTSVGSAMSPTLTNAAVLSVWSRTSGSTLPVNTILMGDVLDTQRRRRDRLVESYSTLPYPS